MRRNFINVPELDPGLSTSELSPQTTCPERIASSEPGSIGPTIATCFAFALGATAFDVIVRYLDSGSLLPKFVATGLLVAAWALHRYTPKIFRAKSFLRLYPDRLDVRLSLFEGAVPLIDILRIDDQRSSFGIVKVYLRSGETIQLHPWEGSMEVLAKTAELAGLPPLKV